MEPKTLGGERMTPIKKLRNGLDELGIEHYDHENDEPLRDLSEAGADPATSWRMGGASVCAVPNKHGTFDLWIDNCTAERSIAATVEREKVNLREMLSESRQANERLYTELKRYKRIFRTRPIAMNILFDENDKLRDIAHKAWRLLLATGNDDLVLSVEVGGVVKEVMTRMSWQKQCANSRNRGW